MASQDVEDTPSSRQRKRRAPETGPFVLRSLLEDVPLSAEGDQDDIEINCVEFFGMYAENGMLQAASFISPRFLNCND